MSVENPLVSVVISVYNTEKYLEECLDSVLNQILKEIEVICIDDKSTDNSLNILEKYAKKDPRIKVLKNEKNTGQAVARNIALKEVKGEYTTFVDSDDKIELDAYEKVYNFSKENKQDMIIFNAIRFDENKEWPSELHEKSIIGETITETNIIEHNEFIYDTGIWNKLIKTSFLKENNIEFVDKLYEDLLFSMELFIATDSVGVYPDVNYYWRKRRNTNKSTTQSRTDIKNIEDRIFISKEIIKLFNSNKKYNCLMIPLYKKLLKFDFRLYIDQIENGNEEYKNIIISEIKPIIESFPKEIFDDLDEIDKIKYNLLTDEKIDSLCFITEKEKEYKKMKKQNEKWAKEIKTVKSTKGWFKYKTNNLYNRALKKE